MKPNFGLINKNAIVNKGLLHIIDDYFTDIHITECIQLQDLCEVSKEKTPDVIIMGADDIEMEKTLLNIRICKSSFPDSRLILYRLNKIYESPSIYFQSGLDGYLGGESGVQELITCIENTLSGKKYLSSDLLVNILLNKSPQNLNTHKKSRSKELSPRESQIASLFLNGNSATVIAKMLSLKPSTISTIKKHILTKMGVSNIIQLARLMG
jgi:DNA-binding NarL/FixJ family response regulator